MSNICVVTVPWKKWRHIVRALRCEERFLDVTAEQDTLVIMDDAGNHSIRIVREPKEG